MGDDPKVARKLFLMESLAIYWNCGEGEGEAYSAQPKLQKLGLFRQSFGGPLRRPTYILEPFTSKGRVTINKQVTDDGGELARPRHAVVLDVDVIPLEARRLICFVVFWGFCTCSRLCIFVNKAHTRRDECSFLIFLLCPRRRIWRMLAGACWLVLAGWCLQSGSRLQVNNLQYRSLLGFGEQSAWLANRARFRHLYGDSDIVLGPFPTAVLSLPPPNTRGATCCSWCPRLY